MNLTEPIVAAFVRGDSAEAMRLLRDSNAHTPQSIADRERLLRFATLLDATRVARGRGDHARTVALAREGVDLALRLEPPERARLMQVLPGLLIEWSRDIREDFDFSTRHALLDRAYAWAMSCRDDRAAAIAAGELAADRAFTGRTEEATIWLDRSRWLANAAGLGETSRARLATALLASLRLDFAGAVRIVESLLPTASTVGPHLLPPQVMRAIWTAPLRPELLPSLIADLESLLASAPWPPLSRAYVTMSIARLHLRAGRPERAIPLLDPREAGALRPMLLVHRSAAHLARGDFHAAELDATEAADTPDSWPRIRTEMGVLAAVARLRLNDAKGAAERFRDAVAQAEIHDSPIGLTVISSADLGRLAELAYGSDVPPIVTTVQEAALPDPAGPPRTHRITAKESRLLHTLLEHPDLRVQELAEHLEVSPNTIKTQLRSLYRKAGVSSRAQLLRAARTRLAL